MRNFRKHALRPQDERLWPAMVTLVVVLFGLASSTAAQKTPVKPAAPGTSGDPAWQRTIRMTDGRTFVSDGGLALDAALAKPAALPAVVVGPAGAKVLEGYMAAPLKDECALADLAPAATGRTYTAPSGVVLNSTYVNYLRRTLTAGRVRLRMKSDLEPIVIVADGAAVGLLMPIKR